MNRKLETFMHIGFVILNCHKNVIINNSIALINHFLIPGAQELVNLMGDNGFEMDGTTYVLTTPYHFTRALYVSYQSTTLFLQL